MKNRTAKVLTRSLCLALAIAVFSLLSCSTNGAILDEPIYKAKDAPPYWADFSWRIGKEGGGNPTWNFKSFAYYVTNPNVNPPTLGNKIAESEWNENPWIVNIGHSGGDYVAFWSYGDESTSYPWAGHTGYTVLQLPYQNLEADGWLIFPYVE
jgi:hypothetical protein